jgi:hypothetical protein
MTRRPTSRNSLGKASAINTDSLRIHSFSRFGSLKLSLSLILSLQHQNHCFYAIKYLFFFFRHAGIDVMQLDAEDDAASQPSIWRDVYNLMRCPGPPCNLGPYCWRDNIGKKHYKLKTHHLKNLIRHVEEGGTLETHDDVLEDIREHLYAKEQQDVERQRKRRASTVGGLPPINITNVLPSQIQTTTEMVLSKPSSPLKIPGQLDVAVRKYSE